MDGSRCEVENPIMFCLRDPYACGSRIFEAVRIQKDLRRPHLKCSCNVYLEKNIYEYEEKVGEKKSGVVLSAPCWSVRSMPGGGTKPAGRSVRGSCASAVNGGKVATALQLLWVGDVDPGQVIVYIGDLRPTELSMSRESSLHHCQHQHS